MSHKALWAMVGISAVAGALGGWSTRLIGSSSEKKAAQPRAAGESPSPGAHAEPTDLNERVASLEREVASLKRDARIARALAAARPDSDADAGTGSGATIDDPLFETAVRDVLDRRDGEQREKWRARMNERMLRRADRFADELAKKLGLRDDQKRKVSEAVREQMEAMFRSRMEEADAGAPGGDDWRARRQKALAALDTKLATVLSPAQVDEMKQLREAGELPGLWGGGRRRRD